MGTKDVIINNFCREIGCSQLPFIQDSPPFHNLRQAKDNCHSNCVWALRTWLENCTCTSRITTTTATTTTTSVATTSTADKNGQSKEYLDNTIAIVGGNLGTIIVLLIVALTIGLFWWRRKRKNTRGASQPLSSDGENHMDFDLKSGHKATIPKLRPTTQSLNVTEERNRHTTNATAAGIVACVRPNTGDGKVKYVDDDDDDYTYINPESSSAKYNRGIVVPVSTESSNDTSPDDVHVYDHLNKPRFTAPTQNVQIPTSIHANHTSPSTTRNSGGVMITAGQTNGNKSETNPAQVYWIGEHTIEQLHTNSNYHLARDQATGNRGDEDSGRLDSSLSRHPLATTETGDEYSIAKSIGSNGSTHQSRDSGVYSQAADVVEGKEADDQNIPSLTDQSRLGADDQSLLSLMNQNPLGTTDESVTEEHDYFVLEDPSAA